VVLLWCGPDPRDTGVGYGHHVGAPQSRTCRGISLRDNLSPPKPTSSASWLCSPACVSLGSAVSLPIRSMSLSDSSRSMSLSIVDRAYLRCRGALEYCRLYTTFLSMRTSRDVITRLECMRSFRAVVIITPLERSARPF
jgi:hypothetical protein